MKKNSKNILKYSINGLVLLLTLYSCVPTRNVRDENTVLPSNYNQKASLDTMNAANMKWKEFFGDAQLSTLIDSALINNQELNIMMQNVNIFQNEVKARTGEYLPSVGIVAGAEVEKVGRYTSQGANDATTEIRPGEEFPEPLNNLSVGLKASWELDIWKKLRNSKKAAVYEYLASIEGKNFMVTNLVSEIASSYYELIALDNQLTIINQNLEIQTNALKIVKLQKQAARATELGVQRFEAELFKNKSEKYAIQQKILETENKINLLLGRRSQHIARSSDEFIEKQIDTVYSGIPAQLLEYRPDIRMASYELEAAKLDVKTAKANFYPSFGITAGVGLEAFNSKYLTTTPESLAYSVVGDFIAPLINRNAIKATYFTATDKQLKAIFEYEKSILNAYLEVENQLSNIQNLKSSYELKEQQVAALNESIAISTRLFQSARVEYLEVLLTQREALEAKKELVESKKDQLLARIELYRALGGGWN